MKIVFIQPKSFFTWEAINFGYLSSYLKKHIDVEIDFFSEFFDDRRTIIDGCKGADIVGFSVTSPQYKNALELAKKVKTKKNHIVFGGFHATNVKEILKNDCIDSVVMGEGEQAILKICEGASGLVKCDFIKDLDFIPFVDRETIKQERNLDRCKKKFGSRIASLLMGRGCPFNCVFCASRSVWSRKSRLRSPENIVEEFKKVVKDYNIDFVNFSDDEIGVNKKHLLEFCELMKDNKTPWGCNMVASCMDTEIVDSMLSAGCTEVWMGVETGDPQILKNMRKPNTVEQIKQGFEITKGKLKRRAYCILGMPLENYDTIKRTEDLIDEIEPEIVGFTIVAPYPGSAFYDEDIHKDVDWTEVDEYTNDLTRTAFLSNEQLKSEQKRLTDKYRETLTFRNIN